MNVAPLRLSDNEKKIVRSEMKKERRDVAFFKPFAHSDDDDRVFYTSMSYGIPIVLYIIFAACMLFIPPHYPIELLITTAYIIGTYALVRGLVCWGSYRKSAEEFRHNFYDGSGSLERYGLPFNLPFNLRDKWREVAGCQYLPAETKQAITDTCALLTVRLQQLSGIDFSHGKAIEGQRDIQESLDREFAALGSAIEKALRFEKVARRESQTYKVQRLSQEASARNELQEPLLMTSVANVLEQATKRLSEDIKRLNTPPS